MTYNAARYIMAKAKSQNSVRVSIAKVTYVLAKLANNYGGFKMARLAFDKMQNHILNPELLEEVEA